jgi:hypothetical protein
VRAVRLILFVSQGVFCGAAADVGCRDRTYIGLNEDGLNEDVVRTAPDRVITVPRYQSKELIR